MTDLEWLSQMISEFETDPLTPVKIYQCTYQTGIIGFLIERCVGCPDFGYELTDCGGNLLCILFGHAGDPCVEYNVDFENKQLLYQQN